MLNKKVDSLRRINDSKIIKGIFSNLPPENYTFHHLGFNFAICKLNEKYPGIFKELYFRTINATEKTYYSKKLEDIKFMFGASGVMDTAMGHGFQYMNIDGKMVDVLKKKTTEELTTEQVLGIKILSKDFVRYLGEYSN